jgi:hypothetical protein
MGQPVEQSSVPDADVYSTGFSSTPIYSHINQLLLSSSVFCNLPPGGDFIVDLQPIAYPGPGTQALTVSLLELGMAGAEVYVLLLENVASLATFIASMTVLPPATFTDYTLTLTQSQVDLIGDYTALQVQLSTAVGVCCTLGNGLLPGILHATFSNGPACLNGQTLTLTFGGSLWQTPSFELCSMTVANSLQLTCSQVTNTWTLSSATGPQCFTITGINPNSVTCLPLVLVFNSVPLNSDCGGGTTTITITW